MQNLIELSKVNMGSKRLYLTSIQSTDANDMYDAIQYSLGILREFPATLPWALDEPSVFRSLEFCQLMQKQCDRNKELVFVIRDQHHQALLGLV